jgi:hypothetical protein
MTYPFLIRGPTRSARVKMVKIEAGSFRHAMLKAFALYPVKYVNFKFAKNMDLISAKQEAKKLSLDGKQRFVVSHKDGECSIEFNEPSRMGDVLHAIFMKGKELKESASAPTTKQPAKAKPAGDSEAAIIEQAEKENKIINKTKSKSMAEKEAKPAKKAAKSVAATVTGDKKTLTVAAILALQKKGMRVYRQANPTAGGILINKRLKEYANKEKQIAVIVSKAA